jgi:hypothetical protein
MSIAIAIAGIALIIAWIVSYARGIGRQRHSRRFRERHITGARPWWKQPPDDGPEGDY